MFHYKSLAFFFASIAIIIKIIVFFTGYQYDLQLDVYVMFANLLLLLLTTFISLFLYKKSLSAVKSNFLDDLKYSMKSAVLYAVILSSYTFLHYKIIDTTYLTNRIDDRMKQAEQIDEAKLKTNPKQFSKAQFLIKEREMANFIFSPFYHASFILFGYIIIGFIYALGITFILRQVEANTNLFFSDQKK